MRFISSEDLQSHYDTTALPIQFSKNYAAFIKQEFGNSITYFEKNEIIVPLEIVGNRYFKQIKLLAAPYRIQKEIEVNELTSYFDDLQKTLKNTGRFMRIVQPHPMAFTVGKPTFSKWCEFGTYITYLQNTSAEGLLNTFDSKYKKAIQHTIKNKGEVIIGNSTFEYFYTVYIDTCKRASISFDPPNYFKNLISFFPNNTITAIINDGEGKTIGAAFFIYNQHRAYCTHAGSSGGSKLYGGMKYLHFEVMKWMRDNNVNEYDFTGVRINSSNETLNGVFKFKKGFGGELQQGFLWKCDLIKWKCIVYDKLLQLKSRGKKFEDIIDQEQ